MCSHDLYIAGRQKKAIDPWYIHTYTYRSWFFIDITAIFPFEILSSSGGGTDMKGALRIARIGRMWKLVKLTRLIRIVKIVK